MKKIFYIIPLIYLIIAIFSLAQKIIKTPENIENTINSGKIITHQQEDTNTKNKNTYENLDYKELIEYAKEYHKNDPEAQKNVEENIKKLQAGENIFEEISKQIYLLKKSQKYIYANFIVFEDFIKNYPNDIKQNLSGNIEYLKQILQERSRYDFVMEVEKFEYIIEHQNISNDDKKILLRITDWIKYSHLESNMTDDIKLEYIHTLIPKEISWYYTINITLQKLSRDLEKQIKTRSDVDHVLEILRISDSNIINQERLNIIKEIFSDFLEDEK